MSSYVQRRFKMAHRSKGIAKKKTQRATDNVILAKATAVAAEAFLVQQSSVTSSTQSVRVTSFSIGWIKRSVTSC